MIPDFNVYFGRIAEDLQKRITADSSIEAGYLFLKRKLLRYKLKKQDWKNYIDRSRSWISGQYALGILSVGSPETIRVLTRYYDWMLLVNRLGMPVFEVPDQIIHAEVLLELYSKHGKKKYSPLIKKAAGFLKTLAQQNNGLIIYWPPEKTILVDSLGMVTNFCYRYSQVFQDSELARIASNQIEYTQANCIDWVSGFPVHSYAYETGTPEGSSSWGRGIGWYLLGLTSYVKYTHNASEKLWAALSRLMEHQDDAGFLYNDLIYPSHIDTSTTCMAALCIAECIASGLLDDAYSEVLKNWFRKSVEALMASVNEKGEVLNCSGECQSAGAYSESYGNFFAQGYTLMILSMINRHPELRESFTKTL